MSDFKEHGQQVQGRASDVCFRNLFGHIEIGVLLADSGFHFVDANPTACRMLGYSRDEMSRLNASDVVLPTGAGHVPPASTGAENAIFHCQAQSFRRSDGSIFSAETLSVGFPDGSLLRIFREIGRIQASSRELPGPLVDPSLDAIVGRDLDGTVRSWNARAQSIFGHRADEIIGTPEETDLLKEAASNISSALADSAREDERRRGEASARSERVFSDTVIESMAGILYLFDEHGQFLRWNHELEIVTDYSSEEIARMQPLQFFSESDQPLLLAKITEVFKEGKASVEAPLLAKSGRTTPYFFTGHRIVFEDKTCLVGVGFDLSERKRAEEALRELNESLERKVAQRTADLQIALARAKAADQTKSAFLATMSHELRTPLNSIIGFSGIMLQELAGELNAEQKKQLGMVRGSARHLLDLINDVLDISKIEAGGLDVSFKAFDIKASIERLVASITPMAEKKRLALSADLKNLPRDFISDQRRVEQMLLNLLSNAVKFTEKGTVKLSAEISSGLAGRVGPVLLVRIEDTGIGIQAEHLPTIFQAFRQIDTGTSRLREGTGLGLAICRRLADRLGGDIQAESEFGRGSAFTLVLPCKGGVRASKGGV